MGEKYADRIQQNLDAKEKSFSIDVSQQNTCKQKTPAISSNSN